jgi:hypothetical protein
LDAQHAIVAIDDLLDDREPEPRPVSRRSFDPVKALQYLAARIFGNADTVILDAQVGAAPVIKA